MTSLLDKFFGNDNSEEQAYKAYFKKAGWTIAEFSALIVGLTPDEYQTINDPNNSSVTKKQFEQYKQSNKIFSSFIKDNLKSPDTIDLNGIHSIEEGLYLSPWRYIKWIAEKQIPFKRKFMSALPLHLLELIQEFSPHNHGLKTIPQWKREHHKLLYQAHALKLIESSKQRLSRDEIFRHPQMEYIARTFIGKDNKQIRYKKRTITESWLAEIDPQKRGRPRKKRRKKRQS